MANKRAKRSSATNRTLADQLNVRIPTELFRRVSAVAGATGKTLAKFVSETLDERTKEHKPEVEKIAEREKQPKQWQ
jgi:predicted HicB family RNase H-like nuclease